MKRKTQEKMVYVVTKEQLTGINDSLKLCNKVFEQAENKLDNKKINKDEYIFLVNKALESVSNTINELNLILSCNYG